MNEVTNAKADRLVEIDAVSPEGYTLPVIIREDDLDKLVPGPDSDGKEYNEGPFVQTKEDLN